MVGEDAERETFRRRVFYIPGYDPFPARRYRELYRSEAPGDLTVTGDPRDPARWQVTGRGAVAEVEVLAWSNIVQASMRAGAVGAYLALARTAWIYLSGGAFFRLARLRKGPALAGLYPAVMLLGQMAVAVWAAMVVFRAASDAPVVAAVLSLLAFFGVHWAFGRADRWFFVRYLMHDYAFTASGGGAVPAALRPRLEAFVARIEEALAGEADEVLVVGHSSGAEHAVRVAAALLRGDAPRAGGPAFGILTLGQSIPVVAALPGAESLHDDLEALSSAPRLTWVDVSAPGDGCSFALCDPVAVAGRSGPGQLWPVVISAAFSQTLSPERWRRLRWRFFRLHFQYLCAFDRPGRYDWFDVTAGPITLADRYGGAASSPGRVARKVAA